MDQQEETPYAAAPDIGYGPPGEAGEQGQAPQFPNDPSNRIIVSGLPRNTDSDELKQSFEEFGQPRIFVTGDKNNEENDFAVLDFADVSSAENALNTLNGMVFRDTKLTMRFGKPLRDSNRGRGGFRGRGRGGFDNGRGRGFDGRGRGLEGRGRGFDDRGRSFEGRGRDGPRSFDSQRNQGRPPRLTDRHIKIHGLRGRHTWQSLKDLMSNQFRFAQIKYTQPFDEYCVVEVFDRRDAEKIEQELNAGTLLDGQRVSATRGDDRDFRDRRSSRSPRRSRSRERGRSRSKQGSRRRSSHRSPRSRSRSRERRRSRDRSPARQSPPVARASTYNSAGAPQMMPPQNQMVQPAPQKEVFYERLIVRTDTGEEKEVLRQISPAELGIGSNGAPAPSYGAYEAAPPIDNGPWGGGSHRPPRNDEWRRPGHYDDDRRPSHYGDDRRPSHYDGDRRHRR